MGLKVTDILYIVVLAGIIIYFYKGQRKPQGEDRTAREVDHDTMNSTFRLLKKEIEQTDDIKKLDDFDHEIFSFGQMYQYNHNGVSSLIVELEECLTNRRCELAK